MDSMEQVAGLKETLESMASEPRKRNGNVVFALVVKVAFDNIKKLREQGFSFQRIMDCLIQNDYLPKDASMRHFHQAFIREERRRKKIQQRGI
jgi:hypothetical protein